MAAKDTSQVVRLVNWLTAFALIFFAVITVTVSLNVPSTYAQSEFQDFTELFSAIHDRMQNEGLLLTIILNTPIAEDSETITVGYGYNDIQVSISEIGDDYFCTREISGGAELINCIPFSNIAGMTYINN